MHYLKDNREIPDDLNGLKDQTGASHAFVPMTSLIRESEYIMSGK